MLSHLCEIAVCPFTLPAVAIVVAISEKDKMPPAICPFTLPAVAILFAILNCAAGHNNAADDCPLDR